jgi:hypothetical protein
MNGFIALFAVDFAKIGIEMNNELSRVISRQQSPAVAVPNLCQFNPEPAQKMAQTGKRTFLCQEKPKSVQNRYKRKCLYQSTTAVAANR